MYEVCFYDFSQMSQQLVSTQRWKFSIKPFRVYSVENRDEVAKKTLTVEELSTKQSYSFEKVIKDWLFRRESGLSKDARVMTMEPMKGLGKSVDKLIEAVVPGGKPQTVQTAGWSIDHPLTEEDRREVEKLWFLEDI